MSDEIAEQVRGKRQSVSLNRLYLDPNNFRFVNHAEYRPVTPKHVYDADVQRRTTGFVLGRHQENVRDLIASIKENGWLDIDPILARKDGVRFLVVEGNRRVASRRSSTCSAGTRRTPSISASSTVRGSPGCLSCSTRTPTNATTW